MINKYKRLGTNKDSKRSECSKRLDRRDFWYLKRLVKSDACVSAVKIGWDLNDSLPKPVTTRTVRTYLKEPGFEYVVTEKKQWLRIQHR